MQHIASDIARALKLQEAGDCSGASAIFESCAACILEHLKDPTVVARMTADEIKHLRTRCEEYINCAHNLRASSQGGGGGTPQGVAGTPQGGGGGTPPKTPQRRVEWDDVVGLEEAKEAMIDALIMPIEFPHLFENEDGSAGGGGIGRTTGVLLYGPPGTGKTYLALATATRSGYAFIEVRSSGIFQKGFGDAERAIRDKFAEARANAPCILFIDEVDSFCSKRREDEHEATRRIKDEMLQELNGVSHGVVVIGATNHPWELDDAFHRRFPSKIYIPLPEFQDRVKLFQLCISKGASRITHEDLRVFAERTAGYSNDEIKTVCNTACNALLRKVREATHFIVHGGVQGDGPIIPCSPSTEGAVEMDAKDMTEDMRKRTRVPPLEAYDILRAIASFVRSSKEEMMKKLEEYRGGAG
jgi:vacuolar protein-sorting-associated protein 4